MVDVKDGKIIRIRPMHYDWKYKREEHQPLEDGGPGQDLRAEHEDAHPAVQHRLQEARLLAGPHPLPHDARGLRPQRRAQPAEPRREQVQAHLLGRGARHHHQRDGPHQGEVRPDRPALPVRPARREQGRARPATAPAASCCALLGGFTLQIRQPDSWEGWWWGSKHFWGCEPVGQGQQSNLLWDISKNAELLLFWGCDQETTPWGWQGQLPSRLSYWWSELGIKQIYVCPDLNYAAAVHADRWIPVLPNTDAALYLAIAYQWFKDGTYDKEYLDTHAVGVDKFEAYVMGEEDGVPKTPEWAAPITRRAGAHHQGPGQGVGRPSAPPWSSATAAPASAAPTPPSRPACRCICLAMQGLGKPGVNQAKMIEWGLFDKPDQYAQPKPLRVPNLRKRLHRRPPRRDQPPVVHPQDLRAQGHPRGRVRLVGLRVRDRRPRQPVRPLQVPGRRLLQDPHGLDRLAVVDHLLERAATTTSGPCGTPTSSSCSPSTRGSRTTACWPTSSCR